MRDRTRHIKPLDDGIVQNGVLKHTFQFLTAEPHACTVARDDHRRAKGGGGGG